MVRWSYGLTTVPERDELLQRTLTSLAAAGFPEPWIFADGVKHAEAARDYPAGRTTVRYPRIRTFANWSLGLLELYYREPTTSHYVMFQDDIVCVRGLRDYLTRTCRESNRYWNLFTQTSNEPVIVGRNGWVEAGYLGNSKTLQSGRGALALVFTRDGVRELFRQGFWADKTLDITSGHKTVDGAVVTAMNYAGYREYIHAPSLVQHTGQRSTMGNSGVKALSFPGEEYDACTSGC